MKSRKSFGTLVVALLCVPALAGAAVITNGIDAWSTPANGSSYMEFDKDPIPAGFFCVGSEPFTGRVEWTGVPLATHPEGALGATDTIVQRLDDLIFSPEGRATTRLQVRALMLASLQPIRTSCGAFNAIVSLQEGPQPITTMEVLEGRSGFGTFDASLAINVTVTFEKVGAVSSRSLAIDRLVELQVSGAEWSSEPPEVPLVGRVKGFVLVDTDGDNRADTYIPGKSNFYPLTGSQTQQLEFCEFDDPCCSYGLVCHQNSGGHCHCTEALP